MENITKKFIQENIIKEDGHYNASIMKKVVIPKEYNWCTSKTEFVEALLFDLKSPPICPVCSGNIKYNRKLKVKPKYSDFCSNSCKIKEKVTGVILTKEYIEANLLREDGHYNTHKTKIIVVPKNYHWCETKSEYLDCIRFDIKKQPKCKNCDKSVKYLSSSKKKIKYQDFCSISCVNKYEGTKDKIKNTNFEKYGVGYYTQTEKYLKKTKNNNLKKYGFLSTNQRNITNVSEFNSLNFSSLQKWIDDDDLFLISDFMEYFNVTRKTVNDLKNKFKIDNPNKQNKSKTQREIFTLLKNETNEVLYNKTDIIFTKKNKFELDIVVPKFNFSIEYNGLTYHSYGISEKYSVLNNGIKEKEILSFANDNSISKNFYNKDKHLLKTELCEEKGIQLFHIFENEWLVENKGNIWISMLKSKMNKNQRIFARKCVIKDLSNNKYNPLIKEFQENNHIQGFHSSKIKLGLFFEEELISLMTFGKTRYNKNYEWEMIRFCSKLNTTIVGGAVNY